MVDFELTSEQRALRDLARAFAEKEIAPVAAHYDRTAEFPWEIAQKAFELGLLNLSIPTEYGGGGLGAFDECLVREEIAAGCAGINTALAVNGLATAPLLIAGTEEQKRAFLPPLTRELAIASYCMTEPDAGSDVAGIRTTARRVGDTYILNGTKRFISGATVARWFAVFAYTDRSAGHDGISCFWVPRETPGVSVPRKEDMMGQRASNTAEVVFQDVAVPAANRIGAEGQGFRIAMAVFNHTRPGVAASAVGLARAALEHAFRYAQTRTAFGQTIASYQAIQFKLAEMAMEIAAARQLTWYAAWLLDRGARVAKEASFAKAFAADTCMRVTTEAVQIFGGYGYSREFPVEKLMRDAKVMQIYEGTSEIQRLIIFRELIRGGEAALRDAGVPQPHQQRPFTAPAPSTSISPTPVGTGDAGAELEAALRQLDTEIGTLSDEDLTAQIAALGRDRVVARLFRSMERTFLPERAQGLRAVVQYVIVDGAESVVWSVQIADGRCEARPGAVDQPAVTLSLGLPSFVRLMYGRLDGMQAFFSGQLKIAGDFALAQRLPNLFRRREVTR